MEAGPNLPRRDCRMKSNFRATTSDDDAVAAREIERQFRSLFRERAFFACEDAFARSVEANGKTYAPAEYAGGGETLTYDVETTA